MVPSILFAQSDEEYSDVINIYKFSGTSEVVRHHLDKLDAKGRFHVLFLVPTPRIFVYGEALISYHIDQLHQAAFKGSVSIILRGKRYWADQKYVRANRWNAPTIIDADGALLKPIKAWDLGPPLMTIWDSTGTLWWWAASRGCPLLEKGLDYSLIHSIVAANHCFHYASFERCQSLLLQQALGTPALGCANTTIRSAIELQDDSSSGGRSTLCAGYFPVMGSGWLLSTITGTRSASTNSQRERILQSYEATLRAAGSVLG